MITILLLLDLLVLFGIGAAVEHEQPFLSVIGTVIFAGILFWVFQTNPITAVATYYGQAILGFIGWFLVGGIVAIAKWGFFIRRKDYETEVKTAYESWTRDTERDGAAMTGPFDKYYRNPFRLDKNVGRIFHWIVFWPSVILWALTYRLVEKIARGIYDSIKGLLNSMANSRVQKIVQK